MIIHVLESVGFKPIYSLMLQDHLPAHAFLLQVNQAIIKDYSTLKKSKHPKVVLKQKAN